jgi:hypothetical protein
MTYITLPLSAARGRLMATAWTLLLVAAPVSAQDHLVVASAQVVTAVDGPPSLRLAANGPLAFTRLPPIEGATGAQVVMRLHGVERVNMSSIDGLAPFVTSTLPGPGFVDLAVALVGTDGRLDVRHGRLSHEIEVVVVQP